MNHPSQFAQPFSWGVAAKAADALLLPASAAPFNHAQMYGDRRAGARSWGQCDRHAPVRGNFVRGRVTDLTTGRGFGLGIFSRAEGHGANRVLAKPINHPLSAERLKNFAKGSKRHFQVSHRYGPEPKRDGAQKNGNGSQEDGVS